MRLFGFGSPRESDEAKQRREASEHNVAAGGLPLDAIDRLKDQANRQNSPNSLFTGDLSVGGLAMVLDAGYIPLGQVMGTSIYQVGLRAFAGNTFSLGVQKEGEIEVVSNAYAEAHRLAFSRLQQEAALLGASGVVGVVLDHKNRDAELGLLEVKVFGTAIREANMPAPGKETSPWLSDLTGNEFRLLTASGYRPLGIAIGNCTYFCFPRFMANGWKNQERTDYTSAMYSARELAMQRMETAARTLGASGVIGADVDMRFEKPMRPNLPDTVYHFTAIGTCIAPITGKPSDLSVSTAVSMLDVPA